MEPQIEYGYYVVEVTNQAILETLFIRSVKSIIIDTLREVFLENLEKVAKGGVSVYRPFFPNKRQKEFVDWIVENSAQIRSRMNGFSYAELGRITGINPRTLKKWYATPEFVEWVNKELTSRLGAAISILKGSMIAEALAPSSTFQEREFALELAGEVKRNFGQTLNVVILGEQLEVKGKAEDKVEAAEVAVAEEVTEGDTE